MAKNKIITVQDVPITVSVSDEQDYICITDMAERQNLMIQEQQML